jgi:peptide/nickel transport system ATP-binding protein/oligopeptide transport system ATP-binding protein
MTNENQKIVLSVKDLRVCFRGHDSVARAVDGVTFDVGPGETVCLVGESGCGKTVSALSILGLVPQPPGDIVDGRVSFMGQNLLGLTDEAMQAFRGNRVAMVFQEPMTSLNPVFTIGDQIAEAITIHEDVGAAKARRRCVQLLEDVGIAEPEERLKDYPHQLSGGQRQRVMIAMALTCNPELVIADEPTTALDVTVQAQILKLFSELQQKRGMSLLYITHDLGVVANIADRIYVMYAGVMVEQGTTNNIFDVPNHPYTKGLLASLPERSKRGTSLKSIPGSVPDPAFKPPGCPFHPRCDAAVTSCRSVFPELCDLGGSHRSRCPVMCGPKR